MSLEFAAPRSPRTHEASRAAARVNYERYSWLFMRISGVVLVILVLGHLLIMNILDGWTQKGDRWLPEYAAGSWGPIEADKLIQRDGRRWRTL